MPYNQTLQPQEPIRPPASLASYRPDPETARRISEYLSRLPEYVPPYIQTPDGRLIRNPQAQTQQQGQPTRMDPSNTDPGLGGLREYHERGMAPGVTRP